MGRDNLHHAQEGESKASYQSQAEGGADLAEGADRSDQGQAGDSAMDIAGLSLPHPASMDGLHGHNQSHPFNSAGQLASFTLRSGMLAKTPCRHSCPCTALLSYELAASEEGIADACSLPGPLKCHKARAVQIPWGLS